MSQSYNFGSQSQSQNPVFGASGLLPMSQNLMSSQHISQNFPNGPAFQSSQSFQSSQFSHSQNFQSSQSFHNSQNFQSSQSLLSQQIHSSQDLLSSQAFSSQQSYQCPPSSALDFQSSRGFSMHSQQGQCGHPVRALFQSGGTGQAGICVSCVCNKIRSSYFQDPTLADISHNYRILHSILTTPQTLSDGSSRDALQAMINVLTEAQMFLTNFPQTMNLVADSLLQLTNTNDFELLEIIVDKVVFQVKQEPTAYSIEWLQGTLRKDECLDIFLRKYGSVVLPNLCITIGSSKNDYELVEKIYNFFTSILSRSPSIQTQFSNLAIGEKDGPVVFFLPSIHKITVDIIAILKETQSVSLMSAIMEFLMQVFQSENALFTAFQSSGAHLCNAFRIVLGSTSSELQKLGVQVLTVILKVYEQNMRKGMTSSNFHYATICSIPLMIIRADVDFLVAQSMHSMDLRLFNDVIEFFDHLVKTSKYPQARALTIVEQSLRNVILTIGDIELNGELYLKFLMNALSDVKVSYVVQEKLLALFTTILSSTAFTLEVKVAYSKMLKFCSDSLLEPTVQKIYETMVQTDENLTCVSELKLTLRIMDTMLNCYSEATRTYVLEEFFIKQLMKPRYLTPIFGLLHTGESEEDKPYITLLLQLMRQINLNTQNMLPQKSGLAERIETVKLWSTSDTTIEVVVPHVAADETIGWTGEIILEIAFVVRRNGHLMQQEEIFHKWNQFMSLILDYVAKTWFSQFDEIWPATESGSVVESTWAYYAKFWTTGLSQLDVDITNWGTVLGSSMFNSQDIGGPQNRVKYSQDTVLLAYYSYFLIASNARKDLLTPDFFGNLAKLIKSVIMNQNRLLPAWKHLCFYLKIGILLCSSVWFDPALHPTSRQHITDVMSFVKVLLNETPNLDFVSVARIITFRWEVIILFSEFGVLSTEFFNLAVEYWVKCNFHYFEHFIDTYRPSPMDVPWHSVVALRNAFTAIIAGRDTSTSRELLCVWKNRDTIPSIYLEFDDSFVYQTLFRLISDMRITMGFEGESQSSGLEHSVSKLSGFLRIVLETPYNSATEPFLPDFTVNFLKFITNFYKVDKVGSRGFQLLVYWLEIDCLKHSLMVCILNDPDFLEVLETCISFEAVVPENCFTAYKIMTILCTAVDDKVVSCPEGYQKIKWKLTYLTDFVEYSCSNLSYLSFFNRLLIVDLNSKFVKVVEAPESSDNLSDNFLEVFFMVMFGLENMIFKCTSIEASETAAWGTMTEMMKFAQRRCPPPVLVPPSIMAVNLLRLDLRVETEKVCLPNPMDLKLLRNTALHISIHTLLENLIARNASSYLEVAVETMSFLEAWTEIVKSMVISAIPEYRLTFYQITSSFASCSLHEVLSKIQGWLQSAMIRNGDNQPNRRMPTAELEKKKSLAILTIRYIDSMLPYIQAVDTQHIDRCPNFIGTGFPKSPKAKKVRRSEFLTEEDEDFIAAMESLPVSQD